MAELELVSEEASVPDDRAVKRYAQIQGLERQLAKIQKRIADKKTELATLKEQEETALDAMREAARDEGDLPLLNVF